jgi:hypothetical protein
MEHTGKILCIQHTGKILCMQHTRKILCIQHTGKILCIQHTGKLLCMQHTGRILCIQHTGKYWLTFCKMVPVFQYNKVDVMGNSCKRGLDILSRIKVRITYSYFWIKILFPMCWVFSGVILS